MAINEAQLKAIKLRYETLKLDYNTMFKVGRDANEAKKLVQSQYPEHPCIKEFEEAIKLANSKTKEEDRTKIMAVGSLVHGIQVFFGEG